MNKTKTAQEQKRIKFIHKFEKAYNCKVDDTIDHKTLVIYLTSESNFIYINLEHAFMRMQCTSGTYKDLSLNFLMDTQTLINIERMR